MRKKIMCCIPWSEYCDYPLSRKLIKENLSKCMSEIRVIIPSIPDGCDISQKEADDFFEWLSNDLKGYATVERITNNKFPNTTKWSGNQGDNTFSPRYLYPLEYCIDTSDTEYVARIETDFVTDDWDKIQTILDQDFEVLTLGMGSTYRPHGDICFFVVKRELLNDPDITFLNTTRKTIRYIYHNTSTETFGHPDPFIKIDTTQLWDVKDDLRMYDHYEWTLLRCIEKSNKAYLVNPMNVSFDHCFGITQQYFMHKRGETVTEPPIWHPSLLRYVERMKQRIDIDNYNLFPPYKKLIENYCEVYGKR